MEERFTKEYGIYERIIPNFDNIPKLFKYQSHKLVRGFLVILTSFYCIVVLFMSIQHFMLWIYEHYIEPVLSWINYII
jgi:hypothetical protein